MAETLIIEGSITPCAFLARGERAEVQRTPFIDNLVLKGYAVVVEARSTAPVQAVPEAEDVAEDSAPVEPTLPHRGASTAIWRAWLDHNEIEYPADSGRDDLVEIWDEHNTPEPSEASDNEADSSQ